MAMKKFRHYLIKKLGGYVDQNNITLSPPKICIKDVDIETLKVTTSIENFLYHCVDVNDIHRQLYDKISNYMFENNVGRIIEECDMVNQITYFTLLLRVEGCDGTKKEHN